MKEISIKTKIKIVGGAHIVIPAYFLISTKPSIFPIVLLLVWMFCGIGILFKNESARRVVNLVTFVCLIILTLLWTLWLSSFIFDSNSGGFIARTIFLSYITIACVFSFILFVFSKEIKIITSNEIELRKRASNDEVFRIIILILLLNFTIPLAESIFTLFFALFVFPFDEMKTVGGKVIRFLFYAIIWIGLYSVYKKTSRIVIIKNEGKELNGKN